MDDVPFMWLPRRLSRTSSMPGQGSTSESPVPLPQSSIAPTRQPRLLSPNPDEAWPQDVWEVLPPEVQGDVLHVLARLLGRDRTRVYALLRSGDLVAAPD